METPAFVTVQSALAHARRQVDATDARVLLAAALGRDAAYLIAHGEDPLTEAQAGCFERWVARRAAGEPVAYIVGMREFYGRPFRVTRDVLIPRPETELLIEVALEALRGLASPRVLDLGTGSGCIAITLAAECPGARVTAVDASEAALGLARDNAGRLHVRGIDWRVSDWFSALGDAQFELVVSNPPYIAEGDAHLEAGDLRYEPPAALTAGRDGLDALRRIVRDAAGHLVTGGSLWVEHGYGQGAACRALFIQHGYAGVRTRRDLAGLERVTGGTRPFRG